MISQKEVQAELLIKVRGNLLIAINKDNQSLTLSPQRLDQFPMERFLQVMEEYSAVEVYEPLHLYEIKWERYRIIALIEDLLELGFEVCHHHNSRVFQVFKMYNIKIKSKLGRPKIYDDPNERHKVHYYKKKREQEDQNAENLRLKDELEKLKRD